MNDSKPAIQILQSGSIMRTVGLKSYKRLELSINLNASDGTSDAEDLLRFVSDYVAQSGREIRDGETFAYGYWLLQFNVEPDGTLRVGEYNEEATEFRQGASFAMRCWREQHELCEKYQASFTPPRPDKLVVVDSDVFLGLPVQGVRYPSPDDMSGWWITTGNFNGDIGTLTRQHAYHLTAVRPDLIKFLALPLGFRFDLSTFEDVWYDPRVTDSIG